MSLVADATFLGLSAASVSFKILLVVGALIAIDPIDPILIIWGRGVLLLLWLCRAEQAVAKSSSTPSLCPKL